MANFQQLFPTFLQKCAELHELLRIVAFMLFIVGTILLVLHGFTGKTLISNSRGAIKVSSPIPPVFRR
jgi:hypothetical protein